MLKELRIAITSRNRFLVRSRFNIHRCSFHSSTKQCERSDFQPVAVTADNPAIANLVPRNYLSRK